MESKELKQVGLKVTQPRMKILKILRQGNPHLSIEVIHQLLTDSGEDIGLPTIYRVLAQFEEAGLVKRYHFDSGQALFEFSQGEHHDHILCLDCGQIEEFYDAPIELRQQEIAQKQGFTLAEHRLILYGHCNRPDCPNRDAMESGVLE